MRRITPEVSAMWTLASYLPSKRSRSRRVRNSWKSSSLPLIDESARGHYQAALDILAEEELFDVEPGHDCLSGARIVSEQKTQRRAGQEFAVNRTQLMWQRLDV